MAKFPSPRRDPAAGLLDAVESSGIRELLPKNEIVQQVEQSKSKDQETADLRNALEAAYGETVADYGIKTFLAQLHSKDIARNSRFRVSFVIPDKVIALARDSGVFGADFTDDAASAAKRLQFACETAQFPQTNITVTNNTIYGFPRWQPQTDNSDNIDITFHVSGDMFERKLFDAWLFAISSPFSQNLSYPDEYETEVVIEQLDRHGRVVYQAFLNRAFPITVQALDLNHAAENDYHKLNVSFAFEFWMVRPTSKLDSIFADTQPDRYTPPQKSLTRFPPPVPPYKESFGDKVRDLKGRIDKVLRTTRGLLGQNQNMSTQLWGSLSRNVTKSLGLSPQEAINTVRSWQNDVRAIKSADLKDSEKVVLLAGAAGIVSILSRFPKPPAG